MSLLKNFCLLGLLIFSSCSVRKRHAKFSVPPRPVRFEYVLKVAGVECRRCISNVLHTLQFVSGINDARCFCPKNRMDQAIFTFWSNSPKFSLDELTGKLVRDGFELFAIQGLFTGRLIAAQAKRTCFAIDKFKMRVFIDEELPREVKASAIDPIELEGTLVFDPSNKCFLFAPRLGHQVDVAGVLDWLKPDQTNSIVANVPGVA